METRKTANYAITVIRCTTLLGIVHTVISHGLGLLWQLLLLAAILSVCPKLRCTGRRCSYSRDHYTNFDNLHHFGTVYGSYRKLHALHPGWFCVVDFRKRTH